MEYLNLSVLLVIFMMSTFLLMLLVFASGFLRKKKQSWRVAASRKWLRNFRANKSFYSPVQRFSYIRKVDCFLWEDILMTCFEQRGYRVIRTPATRDGGSDGFVFIDGMLVVVQAKRYKGQISRKHVENLDFLVKNNKKLSKGLFIHTGKSSAPILDYFRSSHNLELISGVNKILSLLDGDDIEIFGVKLQALPDSVENIAM